MGNVYSVLIYSGPLPTSPTVIASPPAGFVYVMRDMVAFNADLSRRYGLTGFELQDSLGTGIWARLATSPSNQNTYHWEGHQVVADDDYLLAQAFDDNWTLRISGYQLTLP